MVSNWKTSNITDLLKPNGIKIGPFGSQLKKELFVQSGDYKVYGQENVYAKDFTLGNRYMSRSHFDKLASCEILPGDFVMSTMGTIGKCAIVPSNITRGIMDSHLIRLRFDEKLIHPSYLLQLFSPDIQYLTNQTDKLSVGGIMDGLSVKIVSSLTVEYPQSIEEQECIVNVLSDMDGMISSLEKLIAKKKAVKQGAMQELLTGRKRLPGYAGEWVEKKIEDFVVRFATGLNPRQNFKLNNGGTNYYVTIKDFREGKLFLDDACDRIDNVALERINERSDLKKNDLLFSSIGRIGDAYLITETPKNWNINESVFALRPNQQIVSPLMLYYLLTSEDVKNKLLDSTTGSTLKSIKLGHLKEITCRFPKVIEEQIAIASILSDMDNEIESLEQKLSKTRQIKQGMMQQLLTGKIRLV